MQTFTADFAKKMAYAAASVIVRLDIFCGYATIKDCYDFFKTLCLFQAIQEGNDEPGPGLFTHERRKLGIVIQFTLWS